MAAVPVSELPETPRRSARIALDGGRLIAGHTNSKTVTAVALPSGTHAWQRHLGCAPTTLALEADEIYVACQDSGEVVVLDAETGAVRRRRVVGHGAFGVIASPDRLYVSLGSDNAIVALDRQTLTETARVYAGTEPRGLAIGSGRLYVVRLLDASVAVFDAISLKPIGQIEIGLQAGMAETITLREDGLRAYVPHERLNVTNMNRTFDTTVFPVVDALDTSSLLPVRREALALDSADTPVSMPAAAVISPDGATLYVANQASNDVSIIDLETGIGTGHVTVGENPRDLAISGDGRWLYTLNEVSGDVTVIDALVRQATITLKLADDPRPPQIRLGEALFRTSRPEGVGRDHWLACASCHLDGGSDGRTWLGFDGGARNTTILRGVAGTEPLHWSGDRANVQAFQKTFTGFMGGKGLSPVELDAVAAFVNSLLPLSSPLRDASGDLTASAVKGAAVFQTAGCAVCHSPAGGTFTDRQKHEVGTGTPYHPLPGGPQRVTQGVTGVLLSERMLSSEGNVPETMGPEYDTPSLRELWHTAPYLHDGRAATLRDVLTTFNATGQHGSTNGLSAADLDALEAFLNVLPLTEAELERRFSRLTNPAGRY